MIFRWIKSQLGHSEPEDVTIDEELQFHIDMRTEENIRNGMEPAAARTAALRLFGGVEQVKQQCREQSPLYWLASILQDLRFGARMLLRNPGFSAVVVFTLALAIGASTAIFSVLYAVMLKSLPYPNADQLVMLWEHNPETGIEEEQVGAASFREWQQHSQSFQALGHIGNAGRVTTFLLTDERGSEQWVDGRFVSSGFFKAFDVAPLLGRTFSEEEDIRNASSPTVVLTYDFWANHYGSDPDVLGKSMRLVDGRDDQAAWRRELTIVGVMPPGFRFPEEASLWLAFCGHGWHTYDQFAQGNWTVGRLKPDVTAEQATAELSRIQSNFAEQHPDVRRMCSHVRAVPMLEQFIGPDTGLALIMLFVAVVFVLLIACVNVANLMLARGAAREKEIAIRVALGAGRFRVVRQLLTESLLLVFLGGAFGLLIAYCGIQILPQLQATTVATSKQFRVDRFGDVGLNANVLGFSLLLCLGTSLLVGLAPVAQALKVSVNDSLKEEGRGTSGGRRRHRLRQVLLVSEVALAMVLLIGSGLMLQTFWRMRQLDVGLTTEHVTKATFDTVVAGRVMPGDNHEVTYQICEAARALPGVKSVGVIDHFPLFDGSTENLVLPDQDDPTLVDLPTIYRHFATPDTFQTLGMQMLKGRDFSEHDTMDATLVCVINQELAESYFHDQEPIGSRIKCCPAGWPLKNFPWLEIVGVVSNVRHFDLRSGFKPAVYRPYRQHRARYFGGGDLVIRSDLPQPDLVNALRHSIEGNQYAGRILTDIGTVNQVISDSTSTERYTSFLLTIFATVALILAVVGIYGVISYSVTQRSQEIGIRLALGAQPGQILRMILFEGILLSSIGVAIGLAFSLAGSQLLTSLLYGVEPADPVTYCGVSILLIVVAALACSLPSRRAMKVSPATALRHD